MEILRIDAFESHREISPNVFFLSAFKDSHRDAYTPKFTTRKHDMNDLKLISLEGCIHNHSCLSLRAFDWCWVVSRVLLTNSVIYREYYLNVCFTCQTTCRKFCMHAWGEKQGVKWNKTDGHSWHILNRFWCQVWTAVSLIWVWSQTIFVEDTGSNQGMANQNTVTYSNMFSVSRCSSWLCKWTACWHDMTVPSLINR